MEQKLANWIGVYHRDGAEVSFAFYSALRPALANVVSKLQKIPQTVAFVLPYARPGMTPDESANAFLFVNGIENLLYLPCLTNMAH